MQATVKWFNARKGFGFLVVDGYEQDIFVHYSVIDGDGFRTLVQGESVEVDIGDDGKGPRAVAVRRSQQPASEEEQP